MRSSRKTVAPRDRPVTGRGVAGALALVAQAQREAADALDQLSTEYARPRLVSQRTAEPVLGLSSGVYLVTVRQYAEAGGEVLELGKARLVEVEPFVRWLRSRGQQARRAPVASVPDGRDVLLSELGLAQAG